MFHIKEDVRLSPCCAMTAAMIVVNEIYKERGWDCVVTSGVEGKHTRSSRHYIGHALDFRIRHVPQQDRDSIRREISGRLGPDFDVVLSPAPNLHVEYDPKTGVNIDD